MTLNTVTLKWDLADLIEAGLSATLSITPTAQLSDTTDHILIPPVARTVSFTGGTGQLAGIVANDNSAIQPAGTGYLISVTASSGQVIVPQFQTQLNFSNGATQWLDALAVVPSVTTSYQYLPLPSGTATAGFVPLATGSGEASAWTAPPSPPWLPGDDGLAAASFDPALCSSAVALAAGTLYLMRLTVRAAATLSYLWLGNNISGSGSSTGTFVGLYSASGSRLTGSADVGGPGNNTFAFGGDSLKLPFTIPQAVAAGTTVYAAVLVNLPGMPSLWRGASDVQAATLSDWVPASGLRYAVAGTGLTSLPSSITMSGLTTSGARTWWAGVS